MLCLQLRTSRFSCTQASTPPVAAPTFLMCCCLSKHLLAKHASYAWCHNVQFALASTLYLVAGSVLSGFVRRPGHSRGMWLSGISNYILAFTFAKAIVNTLL